MNFISEEFDRWHCGPYAIAKYDDGFYAYRYFRYVLGNSRDAKRLHPENKPLPTLDAAIALCGKVSNEPLPSGIRLIDAPIMNVKVA